MTCSEDTGENSALMREHLFACHDQVNLPGYE